ncbi:hypothetical protein LINGRAHAP2_LOCUS36915 [Linum grandiflorum]
MMWEVEFFHVCREDNHVAYYLLNVGHEMPL